MITKHFTRCCGTAFVLDGAPEETALPFTYAGRVYVLGASGVYRVSVLSFSGRACDVCAGFIAACAEGSGVKCGRWRAIAGGGGIFWIPENLGFALVSEGGAILPALSRGRVPIPRYRRDTWYVTVSGGEVDLLRYSTSGLSPDPRFWRLLEDLYPAAALSLGVNCKLANKCRLGAVRYRGEVFPYYQFPRWCQRHTEIGENVWERLAYFGEKFVFCADGVFSIPSRELI